MRSGLILYIVGATLFVATGYVLANRSTLEMFIGGILMYSAVVFVLVLFGVTAIIFGYSQRSKNPNYSHYSSLFEPSFRQATV